MTTTNIIEVNDIKVLSKKNGHIRDLNIKFYEQGHKYEVLTDKYYNTSLRTACYMVPQEDLYEPRSLFE